MKESKLMEIDKLIMLGNKLLSEAQLAHNGANDSECYARLGKLYDLLDDEMGSRAREPCE